MGSRLLVAFFSLFVLVIGSIDASVPAVYIFGDSTADVGNNNFLPRSKAKANFPPNGLDFLHARPTGRFSNSLITADFIAKKLGFKRSPPPFLSLTRPRQAIRGVNFASAGSGIHERTGARLYGDRISLWKQIRHFESVREDLIDHMGFSATQQFLSKSIFFISTGSNDFIDFFTAQNGLVTYNQKYAFIKSLVALYRFQLRALYELGAEKISVIATPPTGCCPSQRALNATGGCLEDLNDLSRMFYMATDAMLKDLSADRKGLKYSLGNLFEMVVDFHLEAPRLGFTELESACCGAGRFNGQAPCTPNATVCSDRKKYLFWDWFHPTQAACEVAAGTLFNGSTLFVSPINIEQLASADY